MKKRMLAILLAVFSVALTACTGFGAISDTDEATQQPAATEAVSEIVSEPVTCEDYPIGYLPGLEKAGVIPAQSGHIGFVICASSPYAANAEEMALLGKAYGDAFGVTVTIEQPGVAAQIDSIQKLLENGVDFLIFAPAGDEPLGEADTLCAAQDVPYMTIGQRIDATPGEGSYICAIAPDEYLNGILTGLSVVDAMTAQYGEPSGNIAEMTGVVSDETSILRSSGLRRALSAYESLRVVCSVAGNNDADTVYKAAVNIFKAYREGELDGIVVPDDGAAVVVLQAALDYDRNDIVGKIWSAGATVEGLTGVYYGQIAQTIETTSQTGMAAMEYAIHYLNGDAGFPPIITSLTRVFSADSQEKKDGIKDMIAALEERGARGCLENVGAYELFLSEKTITNYPQRYDLYANVAGYLGAFEPYTTQKAIYLSQQDEGTDATD